MRPLYILGIDGCSFDVLLPLMDRGCLPHFSALTSSGLSAVLRSTDPPNTPIAWTTMLTGFSAGWHGVYDFRKFEPTNSSFSFINSADVMMPWLWQFPSLREAKSLVINVPITYPPVPINGLMISGMGTPTREGMLSRPEMLPEVLKIAPDYAIDGFWRDYADLQAFYAAMPNIAQQRGRCMVELCRREAPDLFVGVFTETDRVQHLSWHERENPAGPIAAVYKAIDGALGELAELASARGAILLLVSDHGFQELKGDFYPNNLLRSLNLLKFKGDPPSISGSALANRTFSDIDWQRTLFFSYGHFGSVYKNPHWEGDFLKEALLDALVKPLCDLLLHHPSQGGLITSAVSCSEVIAGPYAKTLPTLALAAGAYGYPARDGSEFLSEQIVDRPTVPYTGTHAVEGIFIASGPGVRRQPCCGASLSLCDVLPTALALADFPRPSCLPGQLFPVAESVDGWPSAQVIDIADHVRGKTISRDAGDSFSLAEQLYKLGYL